MVKRTEEDPGYDSDEEASNQENQEQKGKKIGKANKKQPADEAVTLFEVDNSGTVAERKAR